MPSTDSSPTALNVAIVAGILSRPAERRTLPKTGTDLVTLDVTVRAANRPAATVPVAWFGAPAWSADLDVGDAVVVVGRIERRFFRGGRGTESRTEVVADTVVRAAHAKRAAATVRRALDRVADVA